MNYIIGNENIDYLGYLNEIESIITDPNTLFFIDTCFLTQMYKVNGNIRNNFYTWINENKAHIFIPHWAYNEYLKHTIDSSKVRDLYPLNNLKTISKEIDEAFSQIRRLTTPLKLKQLNLENETQLSDYLNETKEKIEHLNKIYQSNDELNEIRNEINKFLPDLVLNNTIEITDDFVKKFNVRIENKTPPGYCEAKKTNIIGDYIIWNEILNHMKTNTSKKCLFLTNDMKKDWIYKCSINRKDNKQFPAHIEIADPRLVKEYKDCIGNSDFYIINFDIFAKCLSQIEPLKFDSMKNYYYVDYELPMGAAEEEPKEAGEISDKDKSIEKILELEEYAIKDSLLHKSSYTLYNEIIDGFKTYVYGDQCSALAKCTKLDLSLLSDSDLFVLGRNIYQSACGGEFDACNLLRTPNLLIKKFGSKTNLIVQGMLFEVFFDKYGKARNIPKTKYLEYLYILRAQYKDDFEKIGKCFTQFNTLYFYYPGCTITNFKIDMTQIEKESKFYINSIKINGKEILSSLYEGIPTRYFEFQRFFYSKDAIVNFFTKELLIPKDLLQFDDNQLNSFQYKTQIDFDSYIKVD